MQTTIEPKTFQVRTPVFQTMDVPLCSTCNSFICDLPYRFLIVKNRFEKHKMLSFHYFFPCWDVDYVCKNLTDYKISKAGFICDSSIKKNPKSINNLKKNTDLWDI